MSADVILYVATPVVVSFGARVVLSSLILPPSIGSFTTTFERVVLPVLVTVKLYVTTSPCLTETDFVAFSNLILGINSVGTSTESDEFTGVPTGGVPLTVAVFLIIPLSNSSCVTICLPVATVDSPGAKVVFCN